MSDTDKKILYIRTSDRTTFKRCRRKWKWSSSFGEYLQADHPRGPLWMGTGFHWALEDYHGYRKYGDPVTAWRKFVEACRKTPKESLPGDWEELNTLAEGMLNYYVEWLKTRDEFETYWLNGVPQVEVQFHIPLPIDPDLVKAAGYDEVRYQGTIDRVCIDKEGRLWLLDYKTAKAFNISHLDVDSQVTSYCWAGSVLYDKPITGFIYQQHKKVLPKVPEPLKRGSLSVAKNQSTTWRLYKIGLERIYGDADKASPEEKAYLNSLAAQEGPEGDAMLIRNQIYRSEYQIASEGHNILLEVQDMLNPNLLEYPNPTRDCSWDCDFMNACIMRNDGFDWEQELELSTVSRKDETNDWRNYI